MYPYICRWGDPWSSGCRADPNITYLVPAVPGCAAGWAKSNHLLSILLFNNDDDDDDNVFSRFDTFSNGILPAASASSASSSTSCVLHHTDRLHVFTLRDHHVSRPFPVVQYRNKVDRRNWGERKMLYTTTTTTRPLFCIVCRRIR